MKENLSEIVKAAIEQGFEQATPQAKIKLMDEMSIPVGNMQREVGRLEESVNVLEKRLTDKEAKEKAIDERLKQKEKTEAEADKRIAAKLERETELDKHIEEQEAAASRYDAAHSAIQKARGAA
jgi:chromosome segregation ATPase